jgi:TonB family protein
MKEVGLNPENPKPIFFRGIEHHDSKREDFMQYTVLLMDYEPRSVEQMRSALESQGYRVLLAPNGVDGIRMFHETLPDLTLIEAMLPKKHGFEVCQELKATEHGKTHPIALMTAIYKGRKYQRQAENDYGCDAYFEKPIADDVLLEKVSQLLEGREPSAQPAEVEAAKMSETVDEVVIEEETTAETDIEITATVPEITGAPAAVVAAAPDMGSVQDEIESRLEEILPDFPGTSSTPALEATPTVDSPAEEPPATVLFNDPVLENPSDCEEEINDVLDAAFDQIGAAQSEKLEEDLPEAELTTETFEEAESIDTTMEQEQELNDVVKNLDSSEATEIDLSEERLTSGVAGLELGEELDVNGIEALNLVSDERENSGEANESPIVAEPAPLPGLPGPDPAPAPAIEKTEPPPWDQESENLPEPSADATPARFEETQRPLPIWTVGLAALVVVGALIGWYLLGPGSSSKETPAATNNTTQSAPIEAVLAPNFDPPAQAMNEGEPLPSEDTSSDPIQLSSNGGNTAEAAPMVTPKQDPPAVLKSEPKPVPVETTPKVTPELQTDFVAETVSGIAGSASAAPVEAVAEKPVVTEPIAQERIASEPIAEEPVVEELVEAPPEPVVPQTPSYELPAEPVTPKAKFGEYYASTQVDTAPVANAKPLPAYSVQDLRGKPSARVTMQLKIDENGKVLDAQWLSGSVSTNLQRSVLKAVYDWSFSPAKKDGTAVKTDIEVSVNFTS